MSSDVSFGSLVRARAGAMTTLAVLTVSASLLVPVVGSPTASAEVTFVDELAGRSTAAMYPSGMEYDAVNDRLVVADTGLDRVLIYSLSGTMLDEFGDYGVADGEFKSPRDVAIDEVGNIYVADAENNRVQKFDSSGEFLLATSNGTSFDCPQCLNTPIGVTWDAINDELLVASTGQNRIKAFDADLEPTWQSPPLSGVASPLPQSDQARGLRDVTRGPDGNLWVTAYYDFKIRAYDVDWEATPTAVPSVVKVLGNGATRDTGLMNFPYNVVFSADGQMAFVSDTGNGRITKWDISGQDASYMSAIGRHCIGHPEPCADPPPEGSGEFNHLRRVAIDSAGRIYGADFWGGGIEVFDQDGASLSAIEGATAPTPGFAEPYGVDVGPDGQVYVMDRLNHRIQSFDAQGDWQEVAGARGARAGYFSWPEAVTVAPDGRVWAVDTRGDNIQRFAADLSGTDARVGLPPTTDAKKFEYPEGADVDASGVVWVADTRNDRLQTYDPALKTFKVVADEGQLKSPMGVAVTSDAVYVADTGHNRVVKLSLDGDLIDQSIEPLDGPEGLEVAPDGSVWIADTGQSRIVHLSADLAINLGDGFGSYGTSGGNFELNRPHDVAVGNGQLYVADTYDDRVQIFDIDETPPPVFQPSYTDEISDPGGVAPIYPAGVAVGGDGTWFVADSGGSRIATVDPNTGAATTVNATTLIGDPRDLEFDAGDSNSLWVANTGKSNILKLSRAGAIQATIEGPYLKEPYGVANDSARVYVANTYLKGTNNTGNVVAFDKNNLSGPPVWTQNTCGGKAFSRPRDVGVADNGNLLVADTDNARIVVLDADTGSCVAGAGFGSVGGQVGQFRSPRSVTADGSGGVWVADALNYRIQHLTMSGAAKGSPTTLGAFGSDVDQFRSAHCIAQLPDGGVAVCDTFNFRIKTYSVAVDGAPTLDDIVGGQQPVAGGFNGAFAAAYGPSGELYVVDWMNHRIQRFNADGTVDDAWNVGGYGSKPGSLIFPRGVVVAPNGNVVVTDSENNRLSIFTPDGTPLTPVKPPSGVTPLSRPHQTALDGSGGYWVADTLNNRVVHLSASGSVLPPFRITGSAVGGSKPQGIAVDSDGTLLVSNTQNNVVQRYTPGGGFVENLVPGLKLKDPSALLITGMGTDKKIWISDTGNNRIVVLGPNGQLLTTFGTSGAGDAQFAVPRGVAVDPTDGDIAVADYANNSVSLWSPFGGTAPVIDTTPPAIPIVSSPAAGATVSSPVSFAGSATDDIAVDRVTLSIRRNSDMQWWNGVSWQPTAFMVNATVTGAGTPSAAWTYSLPATGGKYGFRAKTIDVAGQSGAATLWRSFTVQP